MKYGVKGATLQVYFLSIFFAEVAEVNAEALQNPTILDKNIANEVPRQNVFL